LADGGILFLDEIGDYDLKIQTKILRFLDNKTITPVGSGKSKQLDLQLILASNQDIPALIKEKRFREDLYQRINRIRIELPALRDRTEDIPILTLSFFHLFKEKEKTKLVSVDPSVIDLFSSYSWPGNIRELQSVIWDACTKARLYGDTILQTKHLKRELADPSSSQAVFPIPDDNKSTQERIVILNFDQLTKHCRKVSDRRQSRLKCSE
jgi:two-component system nitrogen regulation response regulator GlnG